MGGGTGWEMAAVAELLSSVCRGSGTWLGHRQSSEHIDVQSLMWIILKTEEKLLAVARVRTQLLRMLDLPDMWTPSQLFPAFWIDTAEAITKLLPDPTTHKHAAGAQPFCKARAGQPALQSHRWPLLKGCSTSLLPNSPPLRSAG